MASFKCGNITANYSTGDVEEYVARDITQTIQKISWHYPDDFFYNMAYPSLTFDLEKINGSSEYQIKFYGYGWVADTYLEFTKELYHKLLEKYSVSIVFYNKDGKLTLKYSDSIFMKTILKNNLPFFILIPLVSILVLFLNDWLVNFVQTYVNNKKCAGLLIELIPLLFYLITVVAYKIQPMISITKTINTVILVLSAFGYYFFTGNGLYGSLILLVLMVIRIIQTFL